MAGLGSMYSGSTTPNYADVVRQSLAQSRANTGGLDSLMPMAEQPPVVETSEAMPESKRLLKIREAIKEKEDELTDKKEGSTAYKILEKTIDGLKRTAELEEKYARPQSQFSYSAPDILASYTTGDFSKIRKGATSGLEGIQESLDEKQKALDELEFTQTKTRKVPVYSYYEGQSGAPGIAGFNPGVARTTTQIPEGATYRPASQQGFISTPAGYIGPGGTSYTQQGTRNVTETTTRAAKEGDPEYDKQKRIIDALQKEYDRRNKYTATPTNTQNLVGQPVASQPQTMYNINDILKRYIG